MNEDFSKLKLAHVIKTRHSSVIGSICELKDKRLVSCSYDKSIIVYNTSYQPQTVIEKAHDGYIISLCVLANGHFVSSSYDKTIKIWDENDYQLIHTLTGHNDYVSKVIELKDGKICSCSADTTIKIFDNNYYQCITTLTGHSGHVKSIIEIINYIISVSSSPFSSYDGELMVWDKSTYECIQIIYDIDCYSFNGLSKLDDSILLLGGYKKLYFLDIETYKSNEIEDKSLGNILCFHILRNGKILFGNSYGKICCYDLSSKIILEKKFHNGGVSCLIETEDNILVSSSGDRTINIYK